MHHIDLSEMGGSELVYADDTLLVGVDANYSQQIFEAKLNR